MVSKTNPIHVKNVCHDIHTTPLTLQGMPLHISYKSPMFKETGSDIAFYNEVITEQKLDSSKTSLVLQCTSDSPYPDVKERDEKAALEIKKWAEFRGIHIIDRKPQENIADAIARGISEKLKNANKITEFGEKLNSGKVRLWSFAEPLDTKEMQSEIRANSVCRP